MDQGKIITIILEENDDIIESVKEAMQKNQLDALRIYAGDGTIRHGKINHMDGENFTAKEINNALLIGVTGKFSKSAKNYYGNLRVQLKLGASLISGSLIEGTAKNGLVLRAKFR